MSNGSQLNNLGEQMKGALNDALTTGDYNGLKSLVTDTVNSALNEAGATASKAWQQKEAWKRQQQEMQGRNLSEEWVRQKARQEQQRAAQEQKPVQEQRAVQERRTVMVRNDSFVAGVLFVVFGGIAGIPLFILTLIGLFKGWGIAAFLFFFLLASILFVSHGWSEIQLVNKAKRYVRLCGDKMYAEVEELASQVGLSSKKVTKELRRILQKGIIPTAHMDKKGTHLMLNEELYKQYRDAENARILREKEEHTAAALASGEPAAGEKTEFDLMLAEGQSYIRKLHLMNDLIPGEVISARLYQLEGLLGEIFERIKKEPEQMNRCHKLMNYYLPTTLKLVESYHEFDTVNNPGEEILSAKKEIEETIDTINEAFKELLNSLFQDKVMDVTTDAQVLQTMLAREGLTKDI